MPDPIRMLGATAAALCVAALAAALGRGASRGRGAAIVQAVAIAAGAAAGLAVLGVRPRWPMREDQDRFLGLVLPASLLMEAVAGGIGASGRARLALRLASATAVAPAILHGSSYVADLAGPASALWPPARRGPILAGLGLLLFGVWSFLNRTASRSGSTARVPLALATAMLGAGACVMLSGYASGGMNGLPLAGALAGAGLAAGDGRPALGFGAVALFGLLLSGWAFGELRPDAAAGLLLAPMLAAVPESPPLLRLPPRLRTGLALILVAAATAAAVGATFVRFRSAVAEAGGALVGGGAGPTRPVTRAG